MVNKTSNRIMNLEDKAREYAEGKSSSSVFRDAHIRDFKAGYEEGLKDSKLLEMLHRIENILTYDTIEPNSPLQEEIYNLINQATEL